MEAATNNCPTGGRGETGEQRGRLADLLLSKYAITDAAELNEKVQLLTDISLSERTQLLAHLCEPPVPQSMGVFMPKSETVTDGEWHRLLKGAALYPPEFEITTDLPCVHVSNMDVAKELVRSAFYGYPYGWLHLQHFGYLRDLREIDPEHEFLETVSTFASNTAYREFKLLCLPIPAHLAQNWGLRFNPIYAKSDQ
jgi:hypothetical protein